MIRFVTYQKPLPLKRPRFFRGHAYDPSKKDKNKWLSNVKDNLPNKPLEGPLNIMLEFYCKRPKSHFRTGKYSHLPKSNAPKYNDKIPDIDNLAKFVLDAMNGTFYKDDKQICYLHCSKKYTNSWNEQPYQIITIQPLEASCFTKSTDICNNLQKNRKRCYSFP